jgi:hypothetical protein
LALAPPLLTTVSGDNFYEGKMILKQGEAKHNLPEHVEIHKTQLSIDPAGDPRTNPGSAAYLVMQVEPGEIHEYQKAKPDLRGQPVWFAIVHGPDTSSLRPYPIPDLNYYAVFRYCPAAKEI